VVDRTRALGPFLCWAIVYADIGTSVYYVPGILQRDVGSSAASFVLATGIAFVFLAVKYAGIAARYPGGGGVVSVAQEAFGPRIGALGGILILVDYFLTAAISAVSGIAYLTELLPALGGLAVVLVVAALLLLGVLNWIGIRESASVSACAGVVALATLVTLAITTGMQADEADWVGIRASIAGAGQIPLADAISGYAVAWLAFSGLESLSQISPAMADPRRRTAALAMGMVAFSVLGTAPLLTAFATNLLDPGRVNPDAFQAELALAVGGPVLRVVVVLSAAALLLFAANTALVGSYHVFGALAEARFLPARLLRRSRRFGTPATAIAVSVAAPIAVVLATRADIARLGDLYAFGLLGAFVLSSTAVDRVSINEGRTGPWFVVGIATSALVIVAWVTNLVQKPDATLFGGGLAAAMLLVALVQRGDVRLISRRAPLVRLEEAERIASEAPRAELLTLADAIELRKLYPAGALVCLRGPNPRLLDEAAAHARGRDQYAVAVLFVEEVPGLFVPRDTEPTEEAREVLTDAFEFFAARGITALPIWRIAQSSGDAIARAARELEVESIFIGTSRRGALWRMLRGDVITRVIAQAPPQARLVIVG
jgi:amino acid transporter/nucleotide-binding universal stress UspA family protein